MVEIIAHRGASRECRENTRAAFARALDQGADGIELDVHATSDGYVVVHHDPVVSVGGGQVRALAGLELAGLAAMGLRDDAGIPTLDEVLTLVGARATVYVEVKGAGIESPVAACLDRHPGVRTAVHAFDHRIPIAVRRLRPGTSIGLLSASYPLDPAALLRAARPADLWQHAALLDRALVEAAHAEGARVIAWTENDPAHARALVLMGVDALCTDTPGLLRAALA